MIETGIDRLTERQRACLRLVLERRNSSEIGRELGISPHAVDKALKLAMAKLGVHSRFEAARLFAAAPKSASAAAPPGPPPGVQTSDPQSPDLPPPPAPRFGLPVPTRDRPVNTLAWWQVVLWGVAIGGAGLALAVVAVALLEALNQLVAGPPASG